MSRTGLRLRGEGSEPLASVQDYFSEFHGCLGITLTNKCNVVCRHCCVESGPDQSDVVDIDAVVARLAESVKRGATKAVLISGGEPLLYPRQIRVLAGSAASLGIPLGLNTNGSWAVSVHRGRQLLASIRGLTQVIVSTDTYHEEYIPLQRVRNALRASVDEGVRAQLSICTADGQPDGFVRRVLDLLGEDLLREIQVGVNPTEPEGRASMLEGLVEGARARGSRSVREPCRRLNRPIVMENGDIHACCNAVMAKGAADTPRNLGNLTTTEFHQAKERASNDVLLQAVRAKGPGYLFDLLERSGNLPAGVSGTHLADPCRLCALLLGCAGTANTLRSLLGSKEAAQDVAIARAGHFDEWHVVTDLARELSRKRLEPV